MARSSSTWKHHLWRFVMHATPLPIFARSRESNFWQTYWQQKQPEGELNAYAKSSPLKQWLAQKIVDLSPTSVLELGCNVGGNLREIAGIDPKIALNGIELNERAIEVGQKDVAPQANFLHGSMAEADKLFKDHADIVFTCAAAMHCDDKIFAAAKTAALSIARKAIVHLEFHAWTPADLTNARNWRKSFYSDRWMRNYVDEYEGHPRVDKIETLAVPSKINIVDNIGRLAVCDITGLVVVHLKA